jgi:hypothetical protein
MKKTLMLLLTISPFTFADSVYQCTVDGVTTFSQMPCDDEYKKVDVYNTSGRGTSPAEQSNSQKDCVEHLKIKNAFKDPDSVRIESTKKIWMTDKSGARQVLLMQLNTKGSDGDYEGAKPYKCFLNHEGTQLSKVQYLIK